MPYGLLFPLFSEPPGLLSGNLGRPMEAAWAWRAPPDIDERAKTMNDEGDFIMVATVDPLDFARFVSKIAHGFAVAKVGQDAFMPLLANFVVGTSLHWPDYLGLAKVQLGIPTDSIHVIFLKEKPTHDGRRALVCYLQLYGSHITPLYEVVVGLIPNGAPDHLAILE